MNLYLNIIKEISIGSKLLLFLLLLAVIVLIVIIIEAVIFIFEHIIIFAVIILILLLFLFYVKHGIRKYFSPAYKKQVNKNAYDAKYKKIE